VTAGTNPQRLPNASVPDGYAVRPATRDDFDRLVAMFLAADLADWGEPDFTAEFLEFEWSMPQLDLSRDTWLVEHGASGDVAGYAWLLARDEHRQLDGWGVIHPGHRGRGIGSALLDRTEARALEHATQAPGDSGTIMRWGVIAPDVAAHAMLEARGFLEERHSWEMEAHVGSATVEPTVPKGIRLRAFDPEADAAATHAAAEEAFAAHYAFVPWSLEHWTSVRIDRPAFDPGLWRLAESEDDGAVVGVLIGVISGDRGFVETLGVIPSWRGRGIGLALLRSSFAEYARRGVEIVALDVDAQNATGAVALYERAGMHMTRQYDTYAKRIGPPALSATC
jgi:mycothiol synthase